MSLHNTRFSVEGKTVLITGATGGIGTAITQTFLNENSTVIAILRSKHEEWFSETPKRLMRYLCDLADSNSVVEIIHEIIKAHQVDVLINCACPNNIPEANKYGIDAFEAIRAVGLDAPYILCGIVAKDMAARGGGSIINITSINAEAAWPENPAYVTVKGGLKMLTKCVARDYGESKVRANNICPGYVHTKMTDKSFTDDSAYRVRSGRTMLNRWGTPLEIADVCLFLASEASSYITGTDIVVDGGWLAKGL